MTVEDFLGREDNCRIQGASNQSFDRLHEEFVPEICCWKPKPENFLFSAFCRLRPKYVLPARYISRNACQCLRHQNVAFKVQAMRKLDIKISENPENVCLHKDNVTELFNKIDDTVTTLKYKTWKRVEVDSKVKKMMVVETEVPVEKFIDIVKADVVEFYEHVNRLREQYKQLKANKETLADKEAIVQMDFSENYSCRALDEVKTAYWALTSVTLHPVVIYFKQNNALCHKIIIIVSDTLVHSAATDYAFIDAIMPEVKKYIPNVQKDTLLDR